MATTTTHTSSSGSIRRLIGIHRKTLTRRLAALNDAIRTTTGTSEEDLEDTLTDSQIETIRSLPEDNFLDYMDFLSDVRTEAVDAYTKLRNLHTEFLADVLVSAKMVLDTFKEVAKTRGIDTSPPQDHSSTPTPSVKIASISLDAQSAINPIPSAPPVALPRRLSASIPPSTDHHQSIPHHDPIHPSNPSNQSSRSVRYHPVDSTIHPSLPHPPGFEPIHPPHPPQLLSHPHHQFITPAIPPPPGLSIPTLYQQSAMAGRVHPPTFNGDITTFAEFRDSFEALFGSLDDVTKLAMLTSCLGPEPRRLISGLRRIDRNFRTAFLILSKEYDKTHLVRHSLLTRLRELPPCDAHGLRLRETYLSLNELLHQLLPEDTDDTSDILSNLVLSKLPPAIQCAVFIQNRDRPIRVMEIITMVGLEVEKERIEATIKNGSAYIPTVLPDPPPSADVLPRNLPDRMRDSRVTASCRLCHLPGHLLHPLLCIEIWSKNRFRRDVVWSQREVYGKNEYVHRNQHHREPQIANFQRVEIFELCQRLSDSLANGLIYAVFLVSVTSLLLFLLSIQLATSYKFLCFSPQFAVSHVNFLAKIADTLVDAGHEVVILAPRVDPLIRGARTKKARVIELPENEFTVRWDAAKTRAMDLYWNTSVLALMSEGSELFESVTLAMNATVNYPGLIEQLRAEKFDAAYSEDPAGFGIFHLAGIEKTAFAVSFANFEFTYEVTQIPSNPSYVPSIFSGWGDRMSFLERVMNTLASCAIGQLMSSRINWLVPLFEDDLWVTMANNSLVLLNSEPLLDYPRPTVHRVIEIGGIVTATEDEPLDEYWSEVLNRRKHTVIFSLGTYIKASTMPDEYKETIRNAFAKFDDVTFIWKYEDTDHNVSKGLSNIVEITWLPQVALLNDKRLTAFITHGGQGSTLEAAYAGVPMLILPTQGDQYRNAAMIKRAGLGNIVQLSDLEGGDHLEEAIRDLLENEQYAVNAKNMAAMLKNRPFTAKEKLVRNMEFLAEYGPLRMLDHEGKNLNFFQYFLIDVLMFIGTVVLLVVALIGICCITSCRYCFRNIKRRYVHLKQD